MAAATAPPNVSAPEIADGLRYMARQPIMDLHDRVYGYELLFRAGPEAIFRGDGNLATRTMLDNSVIFGLERLSGGLPAFVNCTLESLTERMVDVLPPRLTVLELLETLEPTAKLISTCRELKAAGYRIALDDFVWEPRFNSLVELADYIKVDFMKSDAVARRDLFKRLGATAVVMLAEKVESREEYHQARTEGFTLFQGYYFCRPELVKNRKVPSNRLSHIQILKLLQQDPLDLRQLSKLVKQDVSLTYRYLRLVNSPMCALRQEVTSIKSALTLIGDDIVRRIATLAITSELNAKQPPEIMRMAFVRARFCELAAGPCNLEESEQYLLGLFSLLPTMLRIPMEDLAPVLSLREEIAEALLGAESFDSSLLRWAKSHERGDWLKCDQIEHSYGWNQDEMIRFHAEAVNWADAILQFVR